ATDDLDEDVLQVAPAPHLGERAGGADHAVGHDGDVAAELLHDLHDVAGEDHRPAAGDVPVQDVADQGCGDRVHRLEGFIQHQQPRGVQQRAGEADLPLHAGRVVHDQGAPGVRKPQDVEQFLCSAVHLGG